MSGGDVRKLSNEDIQLVQNRIEQCLQHYMNKKEVVNTLIVQDNIQPCITELVWQRLEEENQEFFKAYYLKLLVKDQILEFNRLLSEQVELMHRIGLPGVSPVLPSNGSLVLPTQHISSTSCATLDTRHLKKENMPNNVFQQNCGSAVRSCVQGTVVDVSLNNGKIPSLNNGNVASLNNGKIASLNNGNMASLNNGNMASLNNGNIDVSPNMFLSENSNLGGLAAQHTMNGKIVKAETGYAAGSSHFDFNPRSNYLETQRPLMGDPSVSSFSSVDSNAVHLNEALLDGDAPSFGFFSQLQHMLSLPEFTNDFANGSDLLDSYCRPPFQSLDANNLLDPGGDIESLDPESESLRFQCFGGD
ncbi:hypothetical protein ABFS83_14G051600 [Erythranthe nasuta]